MDEHTKDIHPDSNRYECSVSVIKKSCKLYINLACFNREAVQLIFYFFLSGTAKMVWSIEVWNVIEYPHYLTMALSGGQILK